MKIFKDNYAKLENFLLHQENFKFLKTTHSYHLVDVSPWPAVASLGAFMITSGGVLYMHKFIGGWNLCEVLYLKSCNAKRLVEMPAEEVRRLLM